MIEAPRSNQSQTGMLKTHHILYILNTLQLLACVYTILDFPTVSHGINICKKLIREINFKIV